MANPTTNYGWPMPTSTDLVTDLPADFDAFGQPVDTTLKALNPETTLGDIAYRSAVSNTNTRLGIGTDGQVLAVSGGVPAWTTTADVTPLTTKGDLFTFTTVDARIGVGANDTVLTADDSEVTGLKWAAPAAGGGKVLQVVQDDDTSGFSTASTTYQDTGLSVSITPSSASSKVLITVAGLRAYVINSGTQTGAFATFRLVRTTTALQDVSIGGYNLASTSAPVFYAAPNFGYLDSPATTSATTYKIQGQCEASGSTTCAYTASATQIASIIAYEIGA
jgi:hypothetical protein